MYGVFVIGPPGSGKSTFCAGISQALSFMGRSPVVVNLDPHVTPKDLLYEPSVDICDLVDGINVAKMLKLGPNASLVYSIEYLLANFDWFESNLLEHKEKYFVFDLPGQIELYTHNTAIRTILEKLKKIGFKIVGVNLIDCTLCADSHKYISALLSSLSCQLMLNLPHINILSKIDLLEHVKEDLLFDIDYYKEVQSLEQILLGMRIKDGPYRMRTEKFITTLCELVEDFDLITFATLDIQDKDSVLNVISLIDKSIGYCNPVSSHFSD